MTGFSNIEDEKNYLLNRQGKLGRDIREVVWQYEMDAVYVATEILDLVKEYDIELSRMQGLLPL